MKEVSTIGTDIAKSVFQVHGINEVGEVVRENRLSGFIGSCPETWCSFGVRRAFRTEPGMDQLAAVGRLMRGSSLICPIVSSVM